MKTREAELILVGGELLVVGRRDAHLSFFANAFRKIGLQLRECSIIPDESRTISRLVRQKVAECRLLVVCGGLGATADDVTRDGIAAAIGRPLVRNPSIAERIETLYSQRGFTASKIDLKQAWFPEGAEPLSNAVGIAPGFYLDAGECLVIVLPGPPREVVPMVEGEVLPLIERKFGPGEVITETFRTAGIRETKLAEMLGPLFREFPTFSVSFLPNLGGVDVILTFQGKSDAASRAQARDSLSVIASRLIGIIGHKFYGTGEDDLETAVGRILTREGMTLALAESLTGGYLGKRITDISGSSRYFLGDVVAYSNDAKVDFLGVQTKTLNAYGAVSRKVCEEMAAGVRMRMGATWGLATTGIAGPTGGTTEKPVGLCYYGVSWEGGVTVEKHIFPGDRDGIRGRVTQMSLLLLYERLMDSRRSGKGEAK